MFSFLKTTSLICFEGEDEAAKAAAEATAKATEDAKKKEEVFTQEQVNTMMADEKRKNQNKQRELVTELESLKKNTALTTEERDSLQSRIEELQNQFLTSEEKARQDVEKKKKEFQVNVETLTSERDTWRKKHSQLLIDTEITRSAADGKALHVEQISAILNPKTKLSEKLDDEGRPTGEFEPRVKFADKDKDDKPIILDLTVNEAVKRMKELPQYGNLFEGDKKGGLGGTGSSISGKKVDLVKIAKSDPVAYRKLRKERPELFA